MNFKDYKKLIESSFEKYVTSESRAINESMMYSLNAGGKRLRPILLMEFAKIFGVEIDRVIPFAVSLEMIHTYSLIHDDLPCMDDDDLRRGKATNHKVYGEALALLAGDGLLNLAFETMSNPQNSNGFEPKIILEVISKISSCTGTNGMISGQVFDTDDLKATEEMLEKIHYLKTGKLIESACVAGAILGGATKDEQKKVSDFAINLGMAFQIRDDILDVYGDINIIGKPVGSDEENQKTTYTTLFSLERCEELVGIYTNQAISCLEKFENTENLINLAKDLVKREN